ncbi:hypothetical protein HK100_000347 [Physocladia obscura]|uniref:Glutamyl-tRNA(Gln) amidotransferase subunit B, mitochondrial n=1 Tax=Physocladia obscura TaxID=109957 RepID=A0AAD5XBV6_9FUNG|nr:hypothetical protein HK100_000347 [Physocladia obscura]
MQFLPVIGLEVHAQIKSSAKLFSAAPSAISRLTGAPNANVALFDAAFPGSLPTLNRECVQLALRAAIALDSDIHHRSAFDRKHYFYPDLPHGYQITQHFNPFATGGYLDLTKYDGVDTEKRIRIHQIQIEQDSGKLLPSNTSPANVLVDLNRAGLGVLEIVTRPDFSSASEVLAFMRKSQRLLWHIGVASSDMDEGAWRCDVNISVSTKSQKSDLWKEGVRTELKHVSKFNVVRTAIEFEIARQISILKSGREVLQETMGLDENGHTIRLRGKEDAPDYRYMPEPDLPALIVTDRLINQVAKLMPESLDARRDRLEKDYGLNMFSIGVLMDEPGAVEYYEALANCPLSIHEFGALIDLVEDGKISGIRGKDVLAIMFESAVSEQSDKRLSALEIARINDWLIENDSEEHYLDIIVDELLAKHEDLVNVPELYYYYFTDS